MRFAIASACWRPPRRYSAPAAPDASLEAVAKRAGVGIGTLYRHFPTREALFEAVYRREVEQLSELAEQLKSEVEPVEALRRWLRSNVEFVATKKGMSAALALAVARHVGILGVLDRPPDQGRRLPARSRDRGRRNTLRHRPRDLLRALVGMCYMNDQPGWQASVLLCLDCCSCRWAAGAGRSVSERDHQHFTVAAAGPGVSRAARLSDQFPENPDNAHEAQGENHSLHIMHAQEIDDGMGQP